MKFSHAVLLPFVWSVPTKPGSPSDSLTAPKRTMVPETAGATTVEPPMKKQIVQTDNTVADSSVNMVKQKVSPDVGPFWIVLERQISSGANWKDLLLKNSKLNPAQTAAIPAALMDKVQANILAGSDYITALLKGLKLDSQSTASSTNSIEARAVSILKDIAVKLSPTMHLNIMKKKLNFATLSFWKSVESKIRSGNVWRQVIDGSGESENADATASVMDTVEHSIFIGASSLSAISRYFFAYPDSFSPVLQEAIAKGQNWKDILKKPEHQTVASKVSMEFIEEQASLISSGLHWAEAKAVLFMKHVQPVTQRSR